MKRIPGPENVIKFQNIISSILIGLITIDIFDVFILRSQKRREVFSLARSRSIETGKPLLVLGNPYVDNYSLSVDYGCGDLCIDKDGCPLCRRSTKGNIEDIMMNLENNSFVVFASCILEYVQDLPDVIQNLERISGGDLFVVNMNPNPAIPISLKDKLYPYKRFWRIYNCPPAGSFLFIKIS